MKIFYEMSKYVFWVVAYNWCDYQHVTCPLLAASTTSHSWLFHSKAMTRLRSQGFEAKLPNLLLLFTPAADLTNLPLDLNIVGLHLMWCHSTMWKVGNRNWTTWPVQVTTIMRLLKMGSSYLLRNMTIRRKSARFSVVIVGANTRHLSLAEMIPIAAAPSNSALWFQTPKNIKRSATIYFDRLIFEIPPVFGLSITYSSSREISVPSARNVSPS